MNSRSRLEQYAIELGSRANTIAGQWRIVRQAMMDGRIAPLCVREGAPRNWRAFIDRRADEKAAGHARAAAIAAGCGPDVFIGALLLAGIPCEQAADLADRLSRYIRMSLGLGGQHPLYIVSGHDIAQDGAGYSFRWRGKWKFAPGSYIPSSLHGRVGLEWIKSHSDADPRRWRGPGGGWYLRGRGVHLHGFTAYPAIWRGRGGDGYIVVHPSLGPQGYHASISDPRRAIRAAISAARRRREIAEASKRLMDPSMLAKIFVGRQDSAAAGNCQAGTDAAARYIAAHLHAPASGIGAVRADFLLAIYPGERTEAAVAAAARRMGYA